MMKTISLETKDITVDILFPNVANKLNGKPFRIGWVPYGPYLYMFNAPTHFQKAV